MNRFGAQLLAAVAAMLLLVANTLPAPPPAAATLRFHDARLSHLRGSTIEDPNAQELGTLKDFVLDAASGRLEYAIVGSGGVLGVGRRTQVLPVSALSGATILRGILGTSITKGQLQSYPSFNGNATALPAPSPSRPAQFTPTGRPSVPSRLELASKLLDRTVVNRQHESLGTISDLLVDLERQKPALAIIRLRKFLRRPETFAVPLSLLSRDVNRDLQLDASPQKLEHAPLFTDQAWSAAARQGAHIIYRIAGSAET